MSRKVVVGIFVAIVAAAVLGAYSTYIAMGRKAQSRILEVEKELAVTNDQLFGYTKFTDYISAGKQVMTEQAKFLAAKVVRDYDLVEHLESGKFGLTSKATVMVSYRVGYSFGFDLKPNDFELKATPTGIEMRIGKPILVSSPAVTPLKHEVLSSGLWTHEKDAVISIHQRLPGFAQSKGQLMANDEAIRALCEKKLVEFLRDFIGKQPGVKQVPAITVVYK